MLALDSALYFAPGLVWLQFLRIAKSAPILNVLVRYMADSKYALRMIDLSSWFDHRILPTQAHSSFIAFRHVCPMQNER